MGALLNKVVFEYVQNQAGYDNSEDDIYGAAKALERKLVSEVCCESAELINQKSEELAASKEAEREISEVRTVVLQCIVLAFLIGLSCNHAYTLMQTFMYGGSVGQNVNGTIVGLVACVAVILGILLWTIFKTIVKLYRLIVRKEK